MRKMIQLPNGEGVRSDCIIAVRLGERDLKYKLPPRVIIDYSSSGTKKLSMFGDSHMNTVVCDCRTETSRDALAKDILTQCK